MFAGLRPGGSIQRPGGSHRWPGVTDERGVVEGAFARLRNYRKILEAGVKGSASVDAPVPSGKPLQADGVQGNQDGPGVQPGHRKGRAETRSVEKRRRL